MIEPRDFLTRVFRAGVAAADPRRAARQAVSELDDLSLPVWVIAVGKGAHRMASGAVEALRERNVTVAGGLVVANEEDPQATHGLEARAGDHPTPGPGSFAAALRLAEVAAQANSDSDAVVLVSGGATSLIAAPVHGITEKVLAETFGALLGSGADIGLMNAVRKRLLRFGAGRLAISLGTRRIQCLIASDVIGNDPASIASGPCVADASTAVETRRRLRDSGSWQSLPQPAREFLEAMADGRVPDVPPADHPRFATVSVRVILDRSVAERGAAASAEQLGAGVEIVPTALTGDAATAGREFAEGLLRRAGAAAHCIIWSGETTVHLDGSHAPGGRCQEFALSAGLCLEEGRGAAAELTILAAGTDGRDGPTDAAGAIVDATTCERIRGNGMDPRAALQQHHSYVALDSAGALLKTGSTGTNVNDLVIALRSSRDP